MTVQKNRPSGLVAIDREMARQHADAIASFQDNAVMATKIAASMRRTGRLLLLGMGGSHAVGRAVEPLYRAHGIDAIALPLSEQLGQPLPLAGRTVLVTSQSGESAEVVRWFSEAGTDAETFGLTLKNASFLAPNCAMPGWRRRHRACLRRDPQPDRHLRLASRDPGGARR